MANKLTIIIDANVTALKNGISKATSSVTGFASKAKSAMSGLGGAIAGLGIMAVGAKIQTLVDKFDSINDLSDKLGLTTDEVQKLGAVAKLGGTDLESLQSVMMKMDQIMGDPDKIEKVSEALKDLGINAKEFKSGSAVDQLSMLADAMQKGGKLSSLYDITGKGGANIMPLLRGKSGNDIKDIYNNTSVVDKNTMVAIGKWNDQLDIASQKISVGLMQNAIGPLIKSFGGLSFLVNTINTAFKILASVVIAITSTITLLGKLFGSIMLGLQGTVTKLIGFIEDKLGFKGGKDTMAKGDILMQESADTLSGAWKKYNEQLQVAADLWADPTTPQPDKKKKKDVTEATDPYADFVRKTISKLSKSKKPNTPYGLTDEQKAAEDQLFNFKAQPKLVSSMAKIGGEKGFGTLQNNLQQKSVNLLGLIEGHLRPTKDKQNIVNNTMRLA